MPLSGPSSYSPTLHVFKAHWDNVDVELDADGPLSISDPRSPAGPALGIVVIDDFIADLDGFAASIADDVARGDVADAVLAESKASALAAAQEFGRKVRAEGKLRHIAPRLPALPGVNEGEGPFMNAMTSVRQRWKLANTLLTPTPLTLESGETQAQFVTRLTTLSEKFDLAEDADVDASVGRDRRNEVQDRTRGVLAAYRAAVEARFAPGHPLVTSLPRIYPLSGHTPAAVTASGTWDAGLTQARLTWTASDDADLSHYEIRTSNSGAAYDPETESVLDQVDKAAPREFLTAAGLATSGATARFRLYVILNTDNERGSETVSVTRP
ncbi:MAG: hypothetical protein V4689_07215 [Verrucomicrobiota bacterium]